MGIPVGYTKHLILCFVEQAQDQAPVTGTGDSTWYVESLCNIIRRLLADEPDEPFLAVVNQGVP